MSLKHWKLSLLKDGNRKTLFATTTDQMVTTDLASKGSASLIRVARQYHRRPQTDSQDHRDLAIGAFMKFASHAPYNLDFEHMETAESVPERDPVRHVGGEQAGELVPVWEEAEIE